MCGICGIYTYASEGALATVDGGLIIRMRDTLAHRGPDDAGLYISKDRRVGLGHRRLSIIDLSSAAKQPISNEDDTLWIVFNGEIYNYLDLRVELEGKGHHFRTRSDTEVIIHLYEEVGADCVHRLDGMFSFAIWDSRKQQLFLARDRLGKKPLYYTNKNGVFIFGSEPKAILAHPLVGRDLDLIALSEYLTFNVNPAPKTLFQDIRKLRPGTVLTVSSRGIDERTFWDVGPEDKDSGESEDFYVQRIRELFHLAVKKRMISDVPFGAFLSGGIDSSLTVAYMSQILDQPVKTFTIGFDGKGIDVQNELDYARLVADWHRTHHHELVVSPQEILESLPQVIYHLDDPIGEPAPISNFHIARMVKKSGVTVAQVGEGSDEIFTGYPAVFANLRWHHFWSRYVHLPEVCRRTLYTAGTFFPPWLKNTALNDLTDSSLLEMLRRTSFGQETYWGFGNCFSEVDKSSLLTKAFYESCTEPTTDGVVSDQCQRFHKRFPKGDYLQKVSYIDLKLELAERQLMRVDKMTMAWSVEARVPFLDYQLVEFAMNIPQRIKVKRGPKYILKKSSEGLLPGQVIHRRKMGFPTPVNIYFGPEMREFILNRIFTSKIHRLGFLSTEYIQRMIKTYDQGRTGYFWLIWNIFILTYWYDFWVEGLKG